MTVIETTPVATGAAPTTRGSWCTHPLESGYAADMKAKHGFTYDPDVPTCPRQFAGEVNGPYTRPDYADRSAGWRDENGEPTYTCEPGSWITELDPASAQEVIEEWNALGLLVEMHPGVWSNDRVLLIFRRDPNREPLPADPPDPVMDDLEARVFHPSSIGMSDAEAEDLHAKMADPNYEMTDSEYARYLELDAAFVEWDRHRMDDPRRLKEAVEMVRVRYAATFASPTQESVAGLIDKVLDADPYDRKDLLIWAASKLIGHWYARHIEWEMVTYLVTETIKVGEINKVAAIDALTAIQLGKAHLTRAAIRALAAEIKGGLNLATDVQGPIASAWPRLAASAGVA